MNKAITTGSWLARALIAIGAVVAIILIPIVAFLLGGNIHVAIATHGKRTVLVALR